jgi:hypothetical protein
MKKKQQDPLMPAPDRTEAAVPAATPNAAPGSTPAAAKPAAGESPEPVPVGKPDALASILAGAAAESRRSRQGTFVPASFDFTVRTHDIAGGVQQLRENGRDASWMVFLFDTARPSAITDDQELALQYSVIDGRVGLDWVLVGPRNIADSEHVAAWMSRRGHRVERREMNEVEFLRVEDGDLAALGEGILERLYGVSPNAELGLLIDGIVLSKGKRTIQ